MVIKDTKCFMQTSHKIMWTWTKLSDGPALKYLGTQQSAAFCLLKYKNRVNKGTILGFLTSFKTI